MKILNEEHSPIVKLLCNSNIKEFKIPFVNTEDIIKKIMNKTQTNQKYENH